MDLFRQSDLIHIWPAIRRLIEAGYSLVPVRSKDDPATGKTAKSPYTGWKEYQRRRPTEQEVWSIMNEKQTTAIAVLCGRISGNLEVIDIDNKNKPGIESNLFQDIEKLFPELWKRLRIHRSPSGGYHIFYKVPPEATVPGNKKLASRYSEERIAGTDKMKPVSFFETRGEGGIILIPPSPGYLPFKDVPVPVISWEEREALIALCQSYNEVIRDEPVGKKSETPRNRESYYDKNPFEHFNESPAAETVLVDHGGWRYYGQNNRFIWFTRPDTIHGGIHAALLRDKNLYYFFTTNSVFTAERSYQPATVLSELKHGGDKKLTHKFLVDSGFGIIRKSIEEKIINHASLNGHAIPANLSPESAERLKEAKTAAAALYPHGIFWRPPSDPGGAPTIEREALYRVSGGLGFRYDQVTGNLVQRVGNFVYIRDNRFYYDTLKSYIAKDLVDRDEVCNAYESFLQRSGNFTITRLPLLEEHEILKDTRTESYKYYEDCFIRITSEGYTVHMYPTEGLIWADQVQKRKFAAREGGVYRDFLCKAVEYEKNLEYVELIIGYLAHNYRDERTAYVPVFIEQCEDPMQGGGSGKNLFCNLFRYNTTVLNTPGAQFKYDDSYLQSWKGERIYVISDVEKDFKYIFLKEPSSGDGKLKKLYVNIDTVPCGRMPKFVVLTNYSFEVTDGGLKRRLAPLEFTEFFTKAEGVDIHYGMHFPNDWDEEDWAGYDFIILRSVQRWLAVGLKIPMGHELTEGGWRKKFEYEFGKTITKFIMDHWEEWVAMKEISNDAFKRQIDEYYIEAGIQRQYQLSTFKINRAIEAYAKKHGIVYRADVKRKENGIQYKARTFEEPMEDAPF